MLKDKTTKEERTERSQAKDTKYRKLIKELSYQNEGEPFLKSLNNACIQRLQSRNYYEVI